MSVTVHQPDTETDRAFSFTDPGEAPGRHRTGTRSGHSLHHTEQVHIMSAIISRTGRLVAAAFAVVALAFAGMAGTASADSGSDSHRGDSGHSRYDDNRYDDDDRGHYDDWRYGDNRYDFYDDFYDDNHDDDHDWRNGR
jgi:hypothetical protein